MFQIGNLWMLFGLFALAVPIVLHLLQRRHHEVHDWGAMQFLPDSVAANRRRWLDEILLMLLRMAMIALIVIALAEPMSNVAWLAPLGDRNSREIVVVLDGSYSMDVRVPGQPTPWQEALTWAREHAEQASSVDRHTFLIARQPPVFVQDDELASVLPRGNPDMPQALAAAWKHLERSKAAKKEIIVLTDGQRHGWADPQTLAALDNLGAQWHADAEQAKADDVAVPSLRVVKVGGELPDVLPNAALAPLVTSRGIAKIGKAVSFESVLHLTGFANHTPPRGVKVFIDGVEVTTLPLPLNAAGQVPLSWQNRFDKEGTHLVSFVVKADEGNDVLAADNEQHTVVEVVKEVPILLVDGDKQLAPESSTFFLQRALDTKQVVSHAAFEASMVLGKAGDTAKPAVLVLADVTRFEPSQIDAINRFLAAGGGVLIVAGERVAREQAFYNKQLYRDGQGWLPAKLTEVASSREGMAPEPRKFQHPALELFRKADGSMKQVRFGAWWKVALGSGATVLGTLSNGDPMLLERRYKQGRVILCTVPLDRRWSSNLPSAVEFPVLVHELMYYLAGTTQSASILRNGAPIRIDGGAPTPTPLTLRTPELPASDVEVPSWPWVCDNTGAIGVYQVTVEGRTRSFVVPPDLRESDLTRCTADDWDNVRKRLAAAWIADADAPSVAEPDGHREELWWMLLVGVVGLLCVEVWMTRRMALARGL
jgi:hypothetical protein